jgi:hypothetical protein
LPAIARPAGRAETLSGLYLLRHEAFRRRVPHPAPAKPGLAK